MTEPPMNVRAEGMRRMSWQDRKRALMLSYDAPRPVRTGVRPPGVVSKSLWWMSYRVGRAMARVVVKRKA